MNSKKLIAKNTIMLYLRMIVSMVVGLYTSRVVLSVLGIEDYGIYGIVGGVITMLSFVNGAMAGATSRFLTFELGKGDHFRLKNIFSTSLIIHVIIALAIFLCAETVGVWFLNYKLVIPEGRLFAANVVFQLSIISMFFSVTQVPYNAAILAHEKMDVYAYIELLNVFLKLGIVYMLTFGNFDRLIYYAILTLLVCIFIASIYRIYCIRRFEETRFHWIWDKNLMKPMLNYSGWDLFGTFSVTARQQGTNFLINMFFGVVYNAASSIASTIHGTIMSLSHNILSAFRPQIIKQYSMGNPQESVNLIYVATKFSTILLVIVAIPTIVEMDFIMTIWLVVPPAYASTFCRIMLVAGCVNMCECCVNVGINAYGEMKKMSILTGLCYLGALPIIWIGYKIGLPVETAYYLSIIVCLLSLSIKSFLVRSYIPEFKIGHLLSKSIFPVASIAAVTLLFVTPLFVFLSDGIVRLAMVFLVDICIGVLATFLIALNVEQRRKVVSYMKSKSII